MKVKIEPITSETLKRAVERGRALRAHGAESVLIVGDCLILKMRSGAVAQVPITAIPVRRIASARPQDLEDVEVSKLGDHVWFPHLDEGYNVGAMLDLAFGSTIRAEIGKRGGAKRSAAKSASAARNGLKGGRPRKRSAIK